MWECYGYTENENELDWDDITRQFSFVCDMKGVKQDPIFHAEGDVRTHTHMVVKQIITHPDFLSFDLQTRHVLFAAGIFHDVEKRSTTSEEYNPELNRIQIISPNHAKRGEFTAREILYRELDCPFDVREKICKIVRHHGFPIFALEKSDPQKEVIFTSLYDINHLLTFFAECDMRGRICPDVDEQLFRIAMFKELCLENNCWDKPFEFTSDLARFVYFQKEDSSPSYTPFNDLKMTVHLMCGIPASGKDYVLNNDLKGLPDISLDDIRKELGFKAGQGSGQAVQEAKERAKQFLRVGQDFIWNGTNITKLTRSQLIDLFTSYKKHPAKVVIHYVESQSDKQIYQNKNRKSTVPSKIIDKFVKNLEMPHLSEAHEIQYHLNYAKTKTPQEA